MDAWAAHYGAAVAFVCVSCDGPQLAATFGNELKLTNCHNTWVDEADMPTWGQLGCNGFIVVDGSDAVVCKASPAFLEVKQVAFRHVETLLDALISSNPAATLPELAPGCVDGSVGGACAEVRFGMDVQQLKVPSVRVGVLDEEHARCEAKLKLLGRLTEPPGVDRRRGQIDDALRALLAAYEGHFAHEEALLDEHLYAAAAREGFSADQGARTSHFADHQAMLSAVRRLLDDVPSVDARAVLQLAADFETHATAYDGAYAQRLSAAMDQANPITNA